MPRPFGPNYLVLPLILALAGCPPGWGDRPIVDDDDDSTFPGDDDDTTFPTDDDDSTADDDDSTADDDDSTGSDDDDSTGSDDDDSTADDDDSGSDDDDSTGSDDDDATANPNDGDGDGYEGPFGDGSDCDDLDSAVNPGAVEDPNNGIDDDCDLAIDEAGRIDSVSPGDGIAAGGSLITVTGEGFLARTGVTLGGVTVSAQGSQDTSFTIVAPAGSVGDVDLEVTTTWETLTVTDAFTYTGTASTLDSAEIDGPASGTAVLNAPIGPFTASLTESGVTGTGSAPAGVTGQIGYGTQGQLPTTWPDFFWTDATWSQSDGGSDVFTASVTPHTYGTFVVVFRFSDDGGYNWLYADMNSSTALTATELPMANVTP